MTLRLARRPLPPTLSGILAVLRLLPRVSAPLAAGLAALVLVASLLPLAGLVATGLLVGAVPEAVRGGLDSPAGRRALSLLSLAALLIVADRLLGPLQAALASVFGRRVDRHLQERAMGAVGRPVGIPHLEDPAVLDLLEGARGVGAQGLRPGDAVAALASLLPSWLGALGSAAMLCAFRWWLGFLWLLAWPVVLYYLQREYLRVGEVGYGQASAVRRAGYYRDLALSPAAAKEVRLWGLPGWLEDRYGAAWRGAMAPVWEARRPGRAVPWLSAAAVAGMAALSFGLLAGAAVRGELALGALAVYVQAVLGASSFRAFDDANMILAHAALAVPKVLELEDRLAKEEVRGGDPPPLAAPRGAIRFDGVEFAYPGTERPVLSGLDLEIPAGRSLAVVGANGAGKTTLVKLLCRLYEPTAGRIEVDGMDLASLDPEQWRLRVAAIFQDFARLHLSARLNVAVGAPHLARDLGRLRRAAERAGALELIEGLPEGWDTVLSREYAGGVDLSGGQWQRIALARALFAVEGGARVLVLDEPTASLDVRAEAALYDRFLEITEGLTTILISHRFSTVRRADRIVVLDGGRVAEDGTHEELLARGGRYALLFRLQSERFSQEPEGAAEGVG